MSATSCCLSEEEGKSAVWMAGGWVGRRQRGRGPWWCGLSCDVSGPGRTGLAGHGIPGPEF